MVKSSLVLILIVVNLLINSQLGQQAAISEDRFAVELIDIYRDRVVAVRSKYVLKEETGTGFLICSVGHVIVSSEVCPQGSKEIRVYFSNGKVVLGEYIRDFKESGLSLIQLGGHRFEGVASPVFEYEKLSIGDVVYLIGNSSNTLINDLQISLSRGYVTGSYVLDRAMMSSHYLGPVFEISSSFDEQLRGAPIINRKGSVAGFASLNFRPDRFLTCMIPAVSISKVISYHDSLHSDKSVSNSTSVELGFTVTERSDGVFIQAVEGASAKKSGLRTGLKLLSIGKVQIDTKKKFDDITSKIEPGILMLSVSDEDLVFNINLEIE